MKKHTFEMILYYKKNVIERYIMDLRVSPQPQEYVNLYQTSWKI